MPEGVLVGSRSADSRSAVSRSGVSRSADSASAGSRSGVSRSADLRSTGLRLADSPSASSPSVDQRLAGSRSADSASTGSPSADSPSAGSRSVDQRSADSPSAGSSSDLSSQQQTHWQRRAQLVQAFVQGKAGPKDKVSSMLSLPRAEIEALIDAPEDQQLALAVNKARQSLEATWKTEERRLGPKGRARKQAERLEAWQQDPFLAPEPLAPQETGIQAFTRAAAQYLAQPQARKDAMWRVYAQRPASKRPDLSAMPDLHAPEDFDKVLSRLLAGQSLGRIDLEPLLGLNLERDGAFVWRSQDPPQDEAQKLLRQYYELPSSARSSLFANYEKARQEHQKAQALAQDLASQESEQEAKFEAQAKAQQEAANEVERERQRALLAAQEAKSAAARLAAQERARLLSIRAEQEAWSKKMGAWEQESKRLQDSTMDLVQSVAQLEHKELAPDLAKTYYDRVASVLSQARDRLRERLSEALAGSTAVAQGIDEVGEMPPLTVDKEAIEALRFEIVQRASDLQDRDRAVAWSRMKDRHQDLITLNRARLAMLSRLSSEAYGERAGVSVGGWKTLRDELEQMQLELRVRWLSLRKRFERLSEELTQNVVGLVWGALQVLALALAFRWWRRRGQSVLIGLRADVLSRRKEYPFMVHVGLLLWYVIKIRAPLEWWILGWVIAQLWIPSEWVEATILWTIYKWLVGGTLVVYLLNAVAVQGLGRSKNVKDSTRALRIDTLRLICYTATFMGLLLALAEQLVGRGAFFRWVGDGAWMIYIPMAIYLLVRWQPTVYERCSRVSAKNPVPAWVVRQSSKPRMILGTIVGAGFLFYQGASRRVKKMLMGLESVRKAAAFLLRREVMSQAGEQDSGQHYQVHPAANCAHFDPNAPSPQLLDCGPSKRIARLVESLNAGRHMLVAVTGERGAGKSSFLTRFVQDTQSHVFDELIDCPAQGLDALYREIESKLGASPDSREAFVAALQDRGALVLSVDNLHRLVRPTIGGLAELDAFITMARSYHEHLSWVVSMGASAWRYTQRARGSRVFFDEVLTLRPWKETEIVQLLDSRNAAANIDPDFSGLKLSRPEDEFDADLNPEQSQIDEELSSNRRKYYRILWEYSGGNPGVALHAWRRSLHVSKEEPQKALARVFPNPDLQEIERLSLPALFTLRAIVQLELATEAQIVECTNLAPQDCADAIRVMVSAGYVEQSGPWLLITWDWHRPIVTVLVRQHLLTAA